MSEPQVVPHGSWRSPISSDLIVRGVVGLKGLALDGQDVYWLESRPGEGGRTAIVRHSPDGRTEDVTPRSFSARTRVHEYGGGDCTAHAGTVYFSNFSDQRLYRQLPGQEPQALTAENDRRYADMMVDASRDRIVAVRENHTNVEREPINELVGIGLENDEERVLASGNDFYSSPRVSPDGRRLAWLTWNHPNMPWDGTELWSCELDDDGSPERIERVAGGPEESVFQPEWSPDGTLHFVSDRTGWWNLYRLREGSLEPLCQKEAEFGVPQWAFGMSTYAFLSPTRVVCAVIERGFFRLAVLDTEVEELEPIETPYSTINCLETVMGSDEIIFIAGSPTEPSSVVRLNAQTGGREVLRRSDDLKIDPGYLSVPEPVEFPTEGGLTAYGFFYPPQNRDFVAPEGERPPLLVHSHGGPTSMTTATLDLSTQYMTSRGIAVLDVNYGGSTGYGREYRCRLDAQWGVVDVDDCANGARHVAERGRTGPGGRRAAHDRRRQCGRLHGAVRARVPGRVRGRREPLWG